jgi:hypothetical protein
MKGKAPHNDRFAYARWAWLGLVSLLTVVMMDTFFGKYGGGPAPNDALALWLMLACWVSWVWQFAWLFRRSDPPWLRRRVVGPVLRAVLSLLCGSLVGSFGLFALAALLNAAFPGLCGATNAWLAWLAHCLK